MLGGEVRIDGRWVVPEGQDNATAAVAFGAKAAKVQPRAGGNEASLVAASLRTRMLRAIELADLCTTLLFSFTLPLLDFAGAALEYGARGWASDTPMPVLATFESPKHLNVCHLSPLPCHRCCIWMWRRGTGCSGCWLPRRRCGATSRSADCCRWGSLGGGRGGQPAWLGRELKGTDLCWLFQCYCVHVRWLCEVGLGCTMP